MDFSLTEDQATVRDLANQVLAPLAPTEPKAQYPPVERMAPDETAWRRLAEANLLGLSLSEAAGGSALGLTPTALVVEQAGWAAARVPLVGVLAAALTVDRFGTDAQRRDLLAPVAAGSQLLTAALAEPRALDPGSLHTEASRDGDAWVVSGAKVAVAAADRAERVLLPARAAGDGTVLLLVDPDAPGVSRTAQRASSGEEEFDLDLEGVRVTGDDVVCGPERSDETMAFLLGRATLLTAALSLGLAQRQLEITAGHVSQREQFGVPIGTFQGVAMRVADMLVDVEAMRTTLWQALWRLDNGLPAEEETTIAKFWASEGGERVASSAIHLHGGIGVDTDYPLHHYFLRSKVAELTLGSASWQIDRLGAQIAARAGAPA